MGVVVGAIAALSIGEIAAAVAVGGVAMSIAGAVTHDKTLSTVGMVMGIAGGVAGLGAGLMGAASMTAGEATNLGTSAVSDFFSGAATSAEAAVPAIDGATTGAEAAINAGADTASAAGSDLAGTAGAGADAAAPANPQAFTGQVGATPGLDPEAGQPGIIQNSQNFGPQPESFGPTELTGPSQPPAATPNAGQAPTAQADYQKLEQGAAGNQPISQSTTDATNSSINQSGQVGANSVLAPGGTPADQEAASLWAKIPDWQKAQLLMVGGQAASGLASGLLQGASLDARLSFDKLVNAQRQAQVQRLNSNNSYVPKVAFSSPPSGPAGIISKLT